MFRRRYNGPQPGPAIRALTAPLAARIGLDYNTEALAPGNDGRSLAFALVKPGASLTVALAEPGGFPGVTPKAALKGAKKVATCIGTERGSQTTVLLAHALFAHMACVMSAHGDETSAGAYLAMRDVLTARYPLDEMQEQVLLVAADELEHLRNGTSPPEPYNGFHLAAARGEDPRTDPDLLEIEQRHVGVMFRRRVATAAIAMAVGPSAWPSIESLILPPTALGGRELVVNAAELSDWQHVTDVWRPLLDVLTGPPDT